MLIAKRTAQAEQDLIEIWLYIAQDNPDAADRMLDERESRFQLLSEQPCLGPARPDIAQEMRFFPVGSYLILTARLLVELKLYVWCMVPENGWLCSNIRI